MKYEIKGIKKEETIKKYKIVNGVIIVTYLDDNVKTLPYTAENEKLVVDKMLQQASYRESKLYQAYMNGRIEKEADILYVNFMGIGFTSFIALFDQRYTLGLIALLGTLLIRKKYCENLDNEVNDIKKYHMYLELKDMLEKTLSADTYTELKDVLSDLNINTIDDFSLKDLNNIYKNLNISKQKYVGKFAKSKSMTR